VPLAEHGVELVDPSLGDPLVERLGDAVGQLGHAGGVRRHGAGPPGGDAPLGQRRAAPRANQEQLHRTEVAADRIEHAPAEGTGKPLLGAEQHQGRPGRLACYAGLVHEAWPGGGGEHQRPRDGGGDHRRVAVHRGKLAPRLLHPRSGDPPHRAYDGAELLDAADARADVRKPLGHAGRATTTGSSAFLGGVIACT